MYLLFCAHSSKQPPDCFQPLLMQLRHRGVELGRQVAGAQVHIDHGGLYAAMAGEDRDFVDVPVRSREISETEMPQRMRREVRGSGALCNDGDDLGPGPHRDGFGAVPWRLRQEQSSALTAQGPSMFQLLTKQFVRRNRIRQDARPAVFSGLCTDTDRAPRRIDVVRFKQTQLFTSKPGVITHSQHQAVAKGFFRSLTKDPAPFLLCRNHGQLMLSLYQWPRRAAFTLAEWVPCAASLFHQEVVEHPQRRQMLLDRRIGHAGIRLLWRSGRLY